MIWVPHIGMISFFRYVPAQFLGAEFKSSLMIDVTNVAAWVYMHEPKLGSTDTGVSDSFMAFWFFGPLVFFLVARIMGKLLPGRHARTHDCATLLHVLNGQCSGNSHAYDFSLFFLVHSNRDFHTASLFLGTDTEQPAVRCSEPARPPKGRSMIYSALQYCHD